MIKETKFLEGLYTAEELNPENIKDRNGKIAFLQKLIDIMSKLFILIDIHFSRDQKFDL